MEDAFINGVQAMKIMIIGSKGAGIGAHFAEGLAKAFMEMQDDVSFIDPLELKSLFDAGEWREHEIYKKPIKLSKCPRSSEQDIIFIDECNFEFDKDVNVFTMYYHKYLQRHPSVYFPDVIFYPCQPFLDFFEKQEQAWYNHQVPHKKIMYFAADTEHFELDIKDIDGIVGIGFRRSFESWVKAGGIADGATSDIIESEVNQFKELVKDCLISEGVARFYDTPVSDEKYREILSHSKMTWFPVPAYQYVTRRMFDAMCSGCLCIFKIQNKEHEQVLENMGFVRGKHYIGINDLSELDGLSISVKDRMEIVSRALDVVRERHTYFKRAQQIIATFKECSKKPEKYQKVILDLGCGTSKTPHSIGVDIVQLRGVDVVWNLNAFPYPFESSSMKEIYLNDVLEHLDDPIKVLRECHRILESNGRLYIRVVHWSHRYSYSDPQHQHFFSELVWEFFTGKRRPYYTDFAFKNLKIEYIFDQGARKHYSGLNEKQLLEKAYFHSNIIQGMNITMVKDEVKKDND